MEAQKDFKSSSHHPFIRQKIPQVIQGCQLALCLVTRASSSNRNQCQFAYKDADLQVQNAFEQQLEFLLEKKNQNVASHNSTTGK